MSSCPSAGRTTQTIDERTGYIAQTASLFREAQNNIILGNRFFINDLEEGPSPKVVGERAAPNAILNAGAGTDGATCHHGTCEVVIGDIEKWRGAPDVPILWLTGPAGAGKTVIMKTITTRWTDQPSFFFSKEDNSRNTATPLIATLLHQVIPRYPSLRNSVAAALSDNSRLLDSAFDVQLEQLITNPLRAVQQLLSSYRPLVLLIDGLDECSVKEQRKVLRTLVKALVQRCCPFRVLVASRYERHFITEFEELSSQLVHVKLDDSGYSRVNDTDIHLFVTDELQRVKKTHQSWYEFDVDWPRLEDIESIVGKSSGQFLYAATVVRLIKNSVESPVLDLQKVLDDSASATNAPIFSQLDVVYADALSKASDQMLLKDILHCAQYLKQESDRRAGRFRDLEHPATFQQILSIYNPAYTDHVVRSCMAYLTPVAKYTPPEPPVFHHGSIPDYLADPSRSGEYFVDIDAFNLKVLPKIWEHIEEIDGGEHAYILTKPRKVDVLFTVECIAYYGLCRLRTLPPNFLGTLTTLSLSAFNRLGNVDEMKDIFRMIHGLCNRKDDVQMYRQIIQRWIGNYHFCLGAFDAAKKGLPCSERYIMMAEISLKKGDVMQTPIVVETLRPASDFDTRELESWLDDLLKEIHTHHYPHCIESYKRLLEAWIYWAVSNDISIENLDYLPYGRWYFWQGTVVKWIISLLLAQPWIWT